MVTGPSPFAIEVQNLSKQFSYPIGWLKRRILRALQEVSFSVPPGEAFGLVGPNGSGKSTLLRILNAFFLPTTGRAWIFGVPTSDEGRIKPLIGVIPSSSRGFSGRLNAFQNLEFYAVLQDVPSKQLRARVQELLDLVGLSELGGQPVGTYSTGQRQRLSVARALLPDPPVLLFDEPTRGLDPWKAQALRKWVREELLVRKKKTLLVATNKPEDIHQLCDRVGILRAGRLVWQGAASEAEFGNASG